ncbi:MAG: hypothetical protein CM15mP111_4710 [Hyphomicrobiales bacterium]|nr:MAG: hypothetical protein CM15mP111_4710 [Hyphomicrobiales bacterium]
MNMLINYNEIIWTEIYKGEGAICDPVIQKVYTYSLGKNVQKNYPLSNSIAHIGLK